MKKITKGIVDILSHIYIEPETPEMIDHPYRSNDHLVMTDGHNMIMIHRNIVDDFESYPDDEGRTYHEIMKQIRRNTHRCDITMESLKLLDAYNKVETCYDYHRRCDACDGTGMVEFHFEHNSDDYTTQEECPVCEGQGYVDCDEDNIDAEPYGLPRFRLHHYVEINKALFCQRSAEILIKTMDRLGLLTVHSCRKSVRCINQFSSDDNDIHIIISPCLRVKGTVSVPVKVTDSKINILNKK